jgi:hypothetical protein
VTLKNVPEAACDSEIVPNASYDMYIVQYTGENLPMTYKESRNSNSDAAFERSLKLYCFQRSKQRHNNYFPVIKLPVNQITICASTESAGLILIGLQTKY